MIHNVSTFFWYVELFIYLFTHSLAGKPCNELALDCLAQLDLEGCVRMRPLQSSAQITESAVLGLYLRPGVKRTERGGWRHFTSFMYTHTPFPPFPSFLITWKPTKKDLLPKTKEGSGAVTLLQQTTQTRLSSPLYPIIR